MTGADDISHRHSLPASGLKPASEARSLKVCIVLEPGHEGLRANQLTASCLANLLCRQVGTVHALQLQCASTQRLVPLPGIGDAEDFASAIKQLVEFAVGGRVPLEILPPSATSDADVAICVGGPADAASATAYSIVAIGDGWRAWVGRPGQAPPVRPWSSNPLGPFLAACLGAAEVFKLGRGLTRGWMLENQGLSLWTGVGAASWDDIVDGPAVEGRSLPVLNIIGAGAVGQALVYILRCSGLAHAEAVIIDDDRHDGTNLNRCFLAGAQDVEQPKVDAVARFAGDGLEVAPFDGDLRGYLVGPRPGVGGAAAAEADSLRFGVVVSCVDRGNSRQEVQGLWPQIIFGGSTTGLVARADVYRQVAGEACLACHNPAERDADRIRALRGQLGGMTPGERRDFLLDYGIDVGAVEEELARPTCGSSGEAAITTLAARRPAEFSVGFVSLAAGLLLASNLFRELAFAGAPPRKSMITLTFLKGCLEQAALSVDENCEQQCSRRPSAGG